MLKRGDIPRQGYPSSVKALMKLPYECLRDEGPFHHLLREWSVFMSDVETEDKMTR